MDGVHDLGGMDGFGSPPIEPDEPVFHHDWEGLVYAAFVATLGNGCYNMDEFRHSIERMPPTDYLESSYYDRWLTGITRLLLEHDVITPAEFTDRIETVEADGPSLVGEAIEADREIDDATLLDELFAGVAEAYDTNRAEQEPAFEVGDRVRVRNIHPEGHTRCPRYVRRSAGTIEAIRGTHVLPDANAHGDERAEPVYNVAFDGTELWGEHGRDRDSVHLDLWESYLEAI
ncbi:MAG: nitrile hydratase subunit beta [Halobacteriales archaeon]|nr:nitrile hydratase subunit beta [Halobacteriales archaeon]